MANQYKVLRGAHAVAVSQKQTDGGIAIETRIFKRGEIVTTDIDLVKKFGSEKFQKVNVVDVPIEETSVEADPAISQTGHTIDLRGMTIAQLRTYAAENEIDLSEVRTKDEIITVIEMALENS